MSKIIVLVSFKLNNKDLINDWIDISKSINETIKNAKGFISRDSTINEDGIIHCIVKWENKEAQIAFRNELESLEQWPEMMGEFSRVCDMTTMTMTYNEVL